MARNRTTERRERSHLPRPGEPKRTQLPTPVEPDANGTFTADLSPQWYTVAQLCHRWQLSRQTIYKYIAAGLLPVWRVGPHLYRIATQDVARFETEQKIGPPSR
jgi:excisionase family DNA binding protein